MFGSQSEEGIKTDADGIFGNKCNQNLWIYTADCMPIFFADKRTRNVAALHCGRKGLEKKIIKKILLVINLFPYSQRRISKNLQDSGS